MKIMVNEEPIQDIVFRAMKADADQLPRVEPSARGLGIRPGTDLPVSNDRYVAPETGGMSTVAGSPHDLPRHRRPALFNGEGRDPVFQLPIVAGFEGLQIKADRGPNVPHRLVEPAQRCTLEYYESCLAATRGDWVLLHE